MATGWDQDRRIEARWRRIVREFACSRLGVREFCRVNGLTVSTLHFWHDEFRRRERELHRREYERRHRQIDERRTDGSERSRRAGEHRTDASIAPPALPAFVAVRVTERVGEHRTAQQEVSSC
jgi:hypothetical protein